MNYRSLILGALLFSGCLSPTLPHPPAAMLVVSEPDATGFVTVTGDVLPLAYVSVVNLRLDNGVIVRADASGKFTARLIARIGDRLTIWQQTDTQRGPPVELIVFANDR